MNDLKNKILIGTIKSGLKKEYKKTPSIAAISFDKKNNSLKYTIIFEDGTKDKGAKDLTNSNYLNQLEGFLNYEKSNSKVFIIDFKNKTIK